MLVWFCPKPDIYFYLYCASSVILPKTSAAKMKTTQQVQETF